MAEVKKIKVARVIEKSSGIEGVLCSHTLEKMPPFSDKERTWYTIEPIDPIKQIPLGERELKLNAGEIIEKKSEYEWRIIEIIEDSNPFIYNSNCTKQ